MPKFPLVYFLWGFMTFFCLISYSFVGGQKNFSLKIFRKERHILSTTLGVSVSYPQKRSLVRFLHYFRILKTNWILCQKSAKLVFLLLMSFAKLLSIHGFFISPILLGVLSWVDWVALQHWHLINKTSSLPINFGSLSFTHPCRLKGRLLMPQRWSSPLHYIFSIFLLKQCEMGALFESGFSGLHRNHVQFQTLVNSVCDVETTNERIRTAPQQPLKMIERLGSPIVWKWLACSQLQFLFHMLFPL